MQVLTKNPTNFYAELTVTTRELAQFSGSKGLAGLKAATSPLIVQVFLSKAIYKCVDTFKVGQKMDKADLMETAQIVMNDYYYLKPEEIKFILEGAKRGDYGQVFNRVDLPVVLGWFRSYDEKRSQIAINKNVQQNTEHKKDHLGLPTLDEVKAVHEKMKAPDYEAPKTEGQKVHEMVKVYKEEFTEKAINEKGIYYVTIEGKKLDLNEYLEYKILNTVK